MAYLVPVRRLALLPVVLAALILAAPALAKPRSELEIYQYTTDLGKRSSIDIALHVASDKPAAADALIHVPFGYGLDLAYGVGERVGVTNVTMYKGSAELYGRGTIVAADPEKYVSDSCDPGLHAAVWLLKISIDGRKLQFPVFVDPGRADPGFEAAYTLHVCMRPESQTGGLRLVWLDLNGCAFRNPTTVGAYDWRAVVQTYAADGKVDPASRFEVQSRVPLPQTVTLTSRYDTKRNATVINGQVRWSGHPRANVRVYLSWVAKLTDPGTDIGSVATDQAGRFTFTQRLTKPGWISAAVELQWWNVCGVSSPDIPCELLTISPPPNASHKISLPPLRRR